MAIAIGIVRLSPPLSSWLSSNHCVFFVSWSSGPVSSPAYQESVTIHSLPIVYSVRMLQPNGCCRYPSLIFADSQILLFASNFVDLQAQLMQFWHGHNTTTSQVLKVANFQTKPCYTVMLCQQVFTQVWLLKTATCQWSSFCCRVDAQGIISTKMVPQLWWQLARTRLMKWWRHCCKRVPAWTRVILMHGASHPFPF